MASLRNKAFQVNAIKSLPITCNSTPKHIFDETPKKYTKAKCNNKMQEYESDINESKLKSHAIWSKRNTGLPLLKLNQTTMEEMKTTSKTIPSFDSDNDETGNDFRDETLSEKARSVSSSTAKDSDRIKVEIRVRPFTKQELFNNQTIEAWEISSEEKLVDKKKQLIYNFGCFLNYHR